MKNIRLRAITMMTIPIILFVLGGLILELHHRLFNEGDFAFKLLEGVGTFAIIYGLCSFLLGIAHGIIVMIHKTQVIPKDTIKHIPKDGSIPVAVAATALSRLIGPGALFYKSYDAVLSWDSSDKRINLKKVDGNTASIVFNVEYKEIELFGLEFNTIVIKVNNVKYSAAYKSIEQNAIYAGGVVGGIGSGPAIAVGAVSLNQTGIEGLYDALMQEGVNVTRPNITRALKRGFEIGYIIIAVLSLIVGCVAFVNS